MISRLVVIISVFVIIFVAACTDHGATPPRTRGSATITVTSPAFAAGGPIPRRYSCDGAGISPPLAWHGVPAKARELALVVDDPDAPGGTYTHWMVLGIGVHTTSVRQGSTPANSTEITNSSGKQGYAPLCPPSGTHHYRFTVYALSAVIKPSPRSLQSGLNAIAGHTLAWGRLTGTYHRS